MVLFYCHQHPTNSFHISNLIPFRNVDELAYKVEKGSWPGLDMPKIVLMVKCYQENKKKRNTQKLKNKKRKNKAIHVPRYALRHI